MEETATDENDSDEYVEYRVKRGDTLEKLAQQFNIDKEEITDLNRVAKRRLDAGDRRLHTEDAGRARKKHRWCSMTGP